VLNLEMAKSERKSGEITGTQADKIWEAANHAEQIRQPLNAFLTIHWDNQGGSGTVQERNSHLLIKVRHWLCRRDHDLAVIWVIDHGIVSGQHAHNLINVPRNLLPGFKDMLPQWTGIPALPRDQWPAEKRRKRHVLGYGQDGIWHFERLYDHGVGLRRYILKGAVDRYHRYGIRQMDQGMVIGKRCGTSNSLGKAARSRYLPPAAAA